MVNGDNSDLPDKMAVPQAIVQSFPELPDDLFPLPLTAFEKYLLWDETEQLPYTSFIELHFLDPLQTDLFEVALNLAAVVHPLMQSTITDRDGSLCWVHRPDLRLQIVREDDSAPMPHCQPTAFHLSHELGIRFWYRLSGSGKSRLLIQIHHAVSDGVGLRRFLIDAMTIYSHTTVAKQTDDGLRYPWSKVQPGLLKQRADLSEAFSGPPAKPLTFSQRLYNAYYFHFLLPRPLRAVTNTKVLGSSSRGTSQSTKGVPFHEQSTTDSHEPLEHLVLDRATSSRILEHARQNYVGMNEVALALLFETCCLWNQLHGDRRPGSRIRLLLPYDMRSRIDLKMPACNRLTFSFLGRSQADCASLQGLIPSIQDEINSFSQTHLPMDFYNAISAAVKNPRLMRWMIRRSRNMATAVLTYAGDTSRGMQKYFPEQDGYRWVGDARLESILAAPPVRENTNIALGMCINWGQICISASWNRFAMERKQCAEFLKLYQSRWLFWLDHWPRIN